MFTVILCGCNFSTACWCYAFCVTAASALLLCPCAACPLQQLPLVLAPHHHEGLKVVYPALDLGTGDEAQQHHTGVAPHVFPEVCQQLLLSDTALNTCRMQARQTTNCKRNKQRHMFLEPCPICTPHAGHAALASHSCCSCGSLSNNRCRHGRQCRAQLC